MGKSLEELYGDMRSGKYNPKGNGPLPKRFQSLAEKYVNILQEVYSEAPPVQEPNFNTPPIQKPTTLQGAYKQVGQPQRSTELLNTLGLLTGTTGEETNEIYDLYTSINSIPQAIKKLTTEVNIKQGTNPHRTYLPDQILTYPILQQIIDSFSDSSIITYAGTVKKLRTPSPATVRIAQWGNSNSKQIRNAKDTLNALQQGKNLQMRGSVFQALLIFHLYIENSNKLDIVSKVAPGLSYEVLQINSINEALSQFPNGVELYLPDGTKAELADDNKTVIGAENVEGVPKADFALIGGETKSAAFWVSYKHGEYIEGGPIPFQQWGSLITLYHDDMNIERITDQFLTKVADDLDKITPSITIDELQNPEGLNRKMQLQEFGTDEEGIILFLRKYPNLIPHNLPTWEKQLILSNNIPQIILDTIKERRSKTKIPFTIYELMKNINEPLANIKPISDRPDIEDHLKAAVSKFSRGGALYNALHSIERIHFFPPANKGGREFFMRLLASDGSALPDNDLADLALKGIYGKDFEPGGKQKHGVDNVDIVLQSPDQVSLNLLSDPHDVNEDITKVQLIIPDKGHILKNPDLPDALPYLPCLYIRHTMDNYFLYNDGRDLILGGRLLIYPVGVVEKKGKEIKFT